MGTIYQRRPGGTYYGYWTDAKGKHRRRSLRTRDQAVARARLRQHELVSTDPAAHSHHTLRAAIGDLLNVVAQGNAGATWKSYRQKGANLIEVLGDVELGDLQRDAVVLYVQHRRIERASDSTIHKELVVLRRALREARERSLWQGDPRSIVPSIKVQYHPRERWLPELQLELLLRELAGGRRLWAALASLGGLCLSEIERLEWTHVDLERRSLRVPGTKRANRWRLVPIHPSLLALLKAAEKKRAGANVVSKWPNVRRDLAVAVTRINARELAAADKKRRKPPSPIPIVTPNDLRRTFASWLKQHDVDSMTVAHLLGHSSTRMVELVYGRLSEDTYRRAIATMPKIRAA